MDTWTSLMILQLTCRPGFAPWLSLTLISDLQAFTSSVRTTGVTMSMVPLTRSPAIDMPLLARAVRPPLMHCLALSIVIALQVTVVATVQAGCYEPLFGVGLETARPWFSLALGVAFGFLFGMLLGGLWSGYWIRQEGLQLTHLLLMVWVSVNFSVLNVRWS